MMKLSPILAILLCATAAKAFDFRFFQLMDLQGSYKLETGYEKNPRCHRNLDISVNGDTVQVQTDTVIPSGALFVDVLRLGNSEERHTSNGRFVREKISVTFNGRYIMRGKQVSDCNILGLGCDKYGQAFGWGFPSDDPNELASNIGAYGEECYYQRVK